MTENGMFPVVQITLFPTGSRILLVLQRMCCFLPRASAQECRIAIQGVFCGYKPNQKLAQIPDSFLQHHWYPCGAIETALARNRKLLPNVLRHPCTLCCVVTPMAPLFALMHFILFQFLPVISITVAVIVTLIVDNMQCGRQNVTVLSPSFLLQCCCCLKGP